MTDLADQQYKQEKEDSRKGMKRHLGVFSVFAICSGAMFSSGFFLLPGLVHDETGPSLPLAYLVASLLMLPALLSMAELSAAIPRAGGPYLFLKRSMGPLIGLVGGFGNYIQLLLKGAFAFVGVGAYLSLMVEVPVNMVAIGLIAAFTLLNIIGVSQTAKIEIILVVILLALLAYFVVAGVVELASAETTVGAQFQPFFPAGVEGFVSAVALVFVSFAGIGQISSLAEEVKRPARAMPRGMLWALGVATFVYVVGTFFMVSFISGDQLSDDQTPVATTAEAFSRLPLPVLVIVIAALAAFTSTGNAAILSAARYPLAMARDQLIWSRLGKLSRKGIPKLSVLLTGGILVLLILTLNVEGIAKLGGAFLLFIFIGMCVAVILFRESGIKEYQPGFRAPLYPWLQILGGVVYLGLIIISGLQAVGFIAAVCLLSGLWYFFGVRRQHHTAAAIYQVFGRLAGQHDKVKGRGELGLPMLGSAHLNRLLEQAIIIDLKEEEVDIDTVFEKAAAALADHLGGKQEALAKELKKKVMQWMSPLRSHVAIAPVLLHEIEQPELVVIRGGLRIRDQSLNGLIALVDDQENAARMLELLAQLETTIFHADFPRDWEQATNAEELRKALQREVSRVQSLTICVENGQGALLVDKTLQEAQLPQGSLVMLIRRKGKRIVPNGATRIREGDELTLVVQQKVLQELGKWFGLQKSKD